jgi:hypothetical protein
MNPNTKLAPVIKVPTSHVRNAAFVEFMTNTKMRENSIQAALARFGRINGKYTTGSS